PSLHQAVRVELMVAMPPVRVAQAPSGLQRMTVVQVATANRAVLHPARAEAAAVRQRLLEHVLPVARLPVLHPSEVARAKVAEVVAVRVATMVTLGWRRVVVVADPEEVQPAATAQTVVSSSAGRRPCIRSPEPSRSEAARYRVSPLP